MGGAIYMIGDSRLELNNVIFEENIAMIGGALAALSFTSLNITNGT